MERRPDFEQALSTLQHLEQKGVERNLHGVGKVLGGLLILAKATMEMNQVLIERCDLLQVFGTSFQGMIS